MQSQFLHNNSRSPHALNGNGYHITEITAIDTLAFKSGLPSFGANPQSVNVAYSFKRAKISFQRRESDSLRAT